MNQSDGPRPDLRARWRKYKESRAYWLLGIWILSVGVLFNAGFLAFTLVGKSLQIANIWFGVAGVLVAVAAVTFVIVVVLRALRS